MDFQDGGLHGLPIGTILAIFICKLPQYVVLRSESIGISVQEKSKIDFQDGSHGGQSGFPIGTILTVFDQ